MASAAEEILTSLFSLPVGLSLLARFAPAALAASTYYRYLHRLQSVLTLFIHLLLATSNLSLEHALYLKLAMSPREHARRVHSLVVVTSVPRGALKVQQTVLAASLLALGANAWLSRDPASSSASLARGILAHASLVLSAALTALTLPFDGPSLQVNWTLAGLDSINQQGPETTGARTADERMEFAPIQIIYPVLPERTADGRLVVKPGPAAAVPSSEAAAAAAGTAGAARKRQTASGPALQPVDDNDGAAAAAAKAAAEAELKFDPQGWVKVAETNKKWDVYVRRTAGGRGRGWEIKTVMADDHPLRASQAAAAGGTGTGTQ